MAFVRNWFLELTPSGGSAVDLSAKVMSLEPSLGHEEVDPTAMGSDTRESEPTLKTWSGSATFVQDFAAGSVDATLSDLWANRKKCKLTWRYSTAAKSATNPEYSIDAYLTEYNPGSGSVGDHHTATATFVAAGDLGRSTS